MAPKDVEEGVEVTADDHTCMTNSDSSVMQQAVEKSMRDKESSSLVNKLACILVTLTFLVGAVLAVVLTGTSSTGGSLDGKFPTNDNTGGAQPDMFPPPNDLCSNAIQLTWPTTAPGDEDNTNSMNIVATGTSVRATHEDLGYSRHDFGTKFGFEQQFLDQQGIVCDWRSGSGVWYKVTGRGTGIRASTCSTDAKNKLHSLSVYKGSDCGALNCVVNEPSNCGSSGGSHQRNSLTWFGESGVPYYIYVEATAQSGPGQFSLDVKEFATPRNDICSVATAIELNEPTMASTAGATPEFVGSQTSVHDWEGDILPGVWYTVLGTGNTMKVAAPCGETLGSVTRIHVYEGDCASKRVLGETVTCEPESATYFESVKDQVYHILFQSNDNREAKQMLVTDEIPSFNDMCLGAVGPVQLNESINGDTSEARKSLYNNRRQRRDRGLFSVSVPGLFYTVLGTGEKMRVSTTCDEQLMGAQLELFSGDCQERATVIIEQSASNACVLQQEQGATMSNEHWVSWQSNKGELYYIHVLAKYDTGAVSFSVTEVPSS